MRYRDFSGPQGGHFLHWEQCWIMEVWLTVFEAVNLQCMICMLKATKTQLWYYELVTPLGEPHNWQRADYLKAAGQWKFNVIPLIAQGCVTVSLCKSVFKDSLFVSTWSWWGYSWKLLWCEWILLSKELKGCVVPYLVHSLKVCKSSSHNPPMYNT